MGGVLEQTFLGVRHTNDRCVRKHTDHQRSADVNHTEMWLLFLKRKEPSVGEDLKKTKPYTLLVGSELAQLLWKTVWRSLPKSEQNRPVTQSWWWNLRQRASTSVFSVAPATAANIQNQHKIYRWMNKENVAFVHNRILPSLKKEGNPVICNNEFEPWRQVKLKEPNATWSHRTMLNPQTD